MTEPIQATPFDPFKTPAREGELNLIASVEKSLNESGLNQQVNEVFVKTDTYCIGKPLCFEAQRFLLNRFFNTQLHHIANTKEIDTREERYCLLDEGNPTDWMKSFQNKILPALITHQYPVNI